MGDTLPPGGLSEARLDLRLAGFQRIEGTYINFLTEYEGPDRIEAALGRSFSPLVEIKSQWDPKNPLCTNHNVHRG